MGVPAKYPSWEPGYVRRYNARPEVRERRENRPKKIYPSASKEYQRAYRAKYRAEHPDKIAERRERQKLWYHKNKKWILPLAKKNAAFDADKIRARKRAYWQANKERFKKRRKEYYRANRAKAIAATALWQKNNRQHHLASRRKRYAQPDCPRRLKTKLYSKRRQRSGKATEYERLYKRRNRAEVNEQYARELLAKRSLIPPNKFPLELVRLKQVQMKLKQLAS